MSTRERTAPATPSPAGPSSALIDELRALASRVSTAGPTELLAATTEAAHARALLDGVLVTLAERLEDTKAPATLGWASTKDFLTHVTGGRKGAGAAFVRVADQTRDLPRVREELTTGRISLAQAGVIAGNTTTLPRDPELRTEAADLLLDEAARTGADATDLDHAFPAVVRALDPDGALLRADQDKPRAERGAHSARFLSFSPDRHGGVRIKGYGTIEDVEVVKATLMPLAAPVVTEPGACGGTPHDRRPEGVGSHAPGHDCPDPRCWHDGKDPREAGARMWDALVEGCRRLSASDDLPRAHGTSARIIVTIDHDELRAAVAAAGADRADGVPPGSGHAATGLLPDGQRLSVDAVRRLACDADIVPAVLGTQSEILDLGRSNRLVTNGLWNALVLRDGHCVFPGCPRPPIACDAHHVVHWADGGATDLDNMVLLCRHHHTVVHHSPWSVAIDPVTRRPVWQPPPRSRPEDPLPGRPPPRAA